MTNHCKYLILNLDLEKLISEKKLYKNINKTERIIVHFKFTINRKNKLKIIENKVKYLAGLCTLNDDRRVFDLQNP